MKITTFLKKYSLIDNEFIDNFYSFYDEGKNEYDFTIKLELMSSICPLFKLKDIVNELSLSDDNLNTPYPSLSKFSLLVVLCNTLLLSYLANAVTAF